MPPTPEDQPLSEARILSQHLQHWTNKHLARHDEELLKLRHRIEDLEQQHKNYARKHQLASMRDLYDAQL